MIKLKVTYILPIIIGMIGIYRYIWNMHEWVNPRSNILRKNPYSTSSKKYYINQYNRSSYRIGHSQLKILD